ncbi:MAG: ABC transporter ATP-binding protein [Acidobacteria bacterium]|nr:ABC transporter ATP-binding protein [Acidobacteriota bacterium]
MEDTNRTGTLRQDPQATISEDSQEIPVAELSGVCKRYGSTVALDGVNLKVPAGKLLAVLGPNGAGKTTAISLLLGLLQPDSGKAVLFGKSPLLIESRRKVGVMLQEVSLAPEMRARELIDLVASYYPSPLTVDKVMELTHTTPLAKRLYGKMSGGQKRQVQFAMALVGRPKLLFLDEPTAGLDVQARESIWAGLRQLVENGTSIVLTTHYMEEAEALADRVVVLARGSVVARGSVNEVRARVARKRISCLTKLGVEKIGGWPGVQSVNIENNRMQITVTDVEAETIVRRLLEQDSGLRELEVRRAGLAEAFTEITREVAQ